MKRSFLQFGITVLFVWVLSLLNGTLYGQSCPAGMVAYLKLSENEGPNYADSYSTHDAFAPVAPQQTAGASGRAQMFSATSGTYLTIPDDNAFDWGVGSNFTIELWAKWAGSTGDVQVFIARDDRPYSSMSWYIGANQFGNIEWGIQGTNGVSGSINSPGTYNDNNWHHIVAARNGSTNRNYLYVDGVLQNPGGTLLQSFGSLASTLPVTIGSLLYVGTPSYHLTGSVDEVAIYSRVLDLNTEILPHYNNMKDYQIGYCSGDDPEFLTEPVTEAMAGVQYVYDVDASGNSKPTYSLIVAPNGMSINSTTGMITWTPASQSENGHVVVRATNNKGFVDQDFIIYLASAPVCRPSQLAYWDFNTPGYIDNIQGLQFTGANPTVGTGIAGNGLNFNGVSDSLNLADPEQGQVFFDFEIPGSFSFEVWMKSTGNAEPLMVLIGRDEESNSSQYWLGIYPNGSVAFSLRDYLYQAKYGEDPNYLEIKDNGTVDVLDGSWHHLVATYDDNSGDMKIYVDKNIVAEGNQHFLNMGGDNPLNIGMLDIQGSATKYWYAGTMDELSIYGSALTQQEVNDSYNNAIAGKSACTFNYAPVIISSPDSVVVQNTLFTYNVVAMDINPDDVLSLSMVSAPAWMDGFTYTPGDSTAVITGTPGNDDVGINQATVRVSDGTVAVDQTFQVRVANANDPPSFTSVPVTSVDQNDTYSYIAEAMDPDGDILTYSAVVKPSWLTFDAGTRELTGVPDDAAVGTHNVTLRAADASLHDDQSFTITVNNVNDPPFFTSTPITQTDQNALYSYTVVADDPDEDVLIYTAVQKPAWLTFNQTSHVLSGTPVGTDVGFHNVTLRITDGTEEADQVFQIEVVDVNDAPEFTSTPPLMVDQDANYSYTVLATDADGDPVSYSAPQIPGWLTFNASTRILSGRPGNQDVGVHDIILRVTDGQLETDQSYQLTVNNVNDLPEITSTPVDWARAGEPYLYQITVMDPDPGDQLTFTIDNGPSWLTITPASNTAILSGTPGAGDAGTFAVIIKVSDGTGETAQGFSISVYGVGIENDQFLVNKVYPNPSSEEVHFEFAERGDVHLKLMDVKGAVVREVYEKDTDQVTVNVSELSSDVYFFSVTLNQRTTVGKLIKE